VDGPGRRTRLTGTYTVGYGYDRADHVTSVAYPPVANLPGETVTTRYDALGLPLSLSGTDEYVWTATYDDRGRPSTMGLGPRPGGQPWLARNWTYDSDQRPARTQSVAGGSTVVDPHRRGAGWRYCAAAPPLCTDGRGPPPSHGWVEIHRGRGVELTDGQVIDLDTGAVRYQDDATTGNDLGLSRRADRMVSTPPHGAIKVLDASGEKDPERCTATSPEGWDGTIDGLYALTPGRDICVTTDEHRVAILTVVRPPNGAIPVLTFDYTLWKRTDR
jgi:hypothetical protein